MTIKERVLLFLQESGIKKGIFFNETGIASSNFKGNGVNSELGGDKIVKILTLYPNLSPDWLLLGKGDMLRVEQTHSSPIMSEGLLYKMYKEKEEENKELFKQNILLEEEIKRLKGKAGKFVPDASTGKHSVQKTPPVPSVDALSKQK